GNGTFNYPDGGTYSGEWRNGVREGDGTLCSSNGSEYVGVWRDGKREGQGIYTDQRGQIYRQFYSEDSLKEETAMSWKSLRGNREVGHGTLWERRGLHTMKYDESNAVIYYVYWANGALKRELKVNYRKLNELLNENRLGSIVPYAIEDVTRGLGENGRIKTLGEAQDCLKECSRQIFMDRMHLGAEGFTGGGLELENLVLLATLENSRFKLVRFCSERLSREKMEWHYENLERFLRFVGIDPGNIDNLRENFISVVISTTDLQHAVSVIVDLRILRMARNQSGSINAITKPIIIVFDSSRIIGSPEHKECNLGNIQKHCAFVNRNIQNLGSCWYHAVSATMAVVNDTDIYEGIMGSSVVKKYGLLGSYVWEFCESMDGLLNEFEIKQIQQLQIIANKNGIETIGGQLTSKLLVLESVRNDAEELLRNNRESLAVFGRRITVLIRKKEEGMRANFKGKIKNNLKRKYTGQLSKEIKKITPEFIRGKYNIRMSSREEKFLRAIEKAKVFRTVENKLKSTLSQVNRARNNEKLLQIRRFVAAENRLDPSTEERDMNGANNLVV
ncbi:MAG: hypothetical protein LBB24_02690, partial [Rickettsiales bacterium]|nr:hypothetical protein [Rickettsiales bacterium]